MKYKVSDGKNFEVGYYNEVDAYSVEQAAIRDAEDCDIDADYFTSYVMDEKGEIHEVTLRQIPRHFEIV